jgi:hypothetical protein
MSELIDEEIEAPDTVEPDESQPAEPEPEPDEEEAEEEATPEPEPPEPEGPSPEEMEAAFKKIERSATTYRNRVSDVLGESAQDLTPCPLCSPGIMGMVFPAEWTQPANPLHGRLLDVLKTPAAPELKEDPFTRACDTCGGNGRTLTKGHVPGHETRGCETCKGVGYLAFDANGAQVQNGPATNGAVVIDEDQPLVSGDVDIWGSPRLLDSGFENPNYGKMPQYKLPQYP